MFRFLLFLFSCSAMASSIPEPMVFDLVRGIDSKKGELEVNSLYQFKKGKTLHAPEIEYTFADGFGVELELPMAGSRLEALKGALQWRVNKDSSSLHGVQVIYEHMVEEGEMEVSGLYLLGKRFNKHSTLWMFGGRAKEDEFEPLINANYFYSITDIHELGLEINSNLKEESFKLIPQLHTSFKHFKNQSGLGVDYLKETYKEMYFISRFIFEF